MDTRLQNFWIESINKEQAIRFAWHLRYSKEFAKKAAKEVSQRQKQGVTHHTQKTNMNSDATKQTTKLEDEKEKLPTLDKDSKNYEEHRKKLFIYGDVKYQDMRPPSVETRMLLYEGISHHGEGRYAYLKKRNQKSPKEKYHFPLLSSCQYGWNIKDYNMQKSPFARTSVIRDTFYSHSGVIVG